MVVFLKREFAVEDGSGWSTGFAVTETTADIWFTLTESWTGFWHETVIAIDLG